MSEKNLFNKIEKDYGSDYKNHLFEQYKLYLESIEKISDRRQVANTFFITLNAIIFSTFGINISNDFLSDIKSIISLVGVLFCLIFWNLINSYRQINSGKFKILHEIEEKLPLSLYKYEWEILERGKNKKIYYPFSHIESLIPIIFGFIYLFNFFNLFYFNF